MWTIQSQAAIKDLTIGVNDELLALAQVGVGVDLMRVDPGPAYAAPPPTMKFLLPATPIVAGRPLTVTAQFRGAVAPTGNVTFAAATASTVVTAAAEPAREIPALSPPGLALLIALTALVGARVRRR